MVEIARQTQRVTQAGLQRRSIHSGINRFSAERCDWRRASCSGAGWAFEDVARGSPLEGWIIGFAELWQFRFVEGPAPSHEMVVRACGRYAAAPSGSRTAWPWE